VKNKEISNLYKTCQIILQNISNPPNFPDGLQNRHTNMAASAAVIRDSSISVLVGESNVTSRKLRCSRRQ